MNASVAIQTLPQADNDEELIRIVDEVIAYIRSTGYNYYVGPLRLRLREIMTPLWILSKNVSISPSAPVPRP